MIYQDYNSFALIEVIAVVFLFILIFYAMLFSFLSGSKSRRYRQLLSDMYIVGLIKQFAIKDNIDIKQELNEFNKIVKRTGLFRKGIDEVIEEDLKEKLMVQAENNLEEVNKKKENK